MDKSAIRKMVKERKGELSKDFVLDYSELVQDIFLNSDFYRDATVLYAYLAYNTEIRTEKIIERAWADGKKVCVPRVLDAGYMEFYEIKSFSEISTGYCGIPEPQVEEVSNDENVLIIMPGLAFDGQHNRIGYGGGFYDRYLDRKSNCNFLKISFAYNFQLVDKLETDIYDKKVDYIITEKGLM